MFTPAGPRRPAAVRPLSYSWPKRECCLGMVKGPARRHYCMSFNSNTFTQTCCTVVAIRLPAILYAPTPSWPATDPLPYAVCHGWQCWKYDYGAFWGNPHEGLYRTARRLAVMIYQPMGARQRACPTYIRPISAYSRPCRLIVQAAAANMCTCGLKY